MNARKLMVLLATLSAPAVMAGELEFIGIKPTAVFAKESTHVVVSAKPKTPLAPGEKLMLVELDETGATLKTIGELNDIGRWGDTAKDDGYLSKQFQLYEKNGDQKRRYAVVRQTGEAEIDPKLVEAAEIVSVDVLRRPTIIEIVARIWSRLKG